MKQGTCCTPLPVLHVEEAVERMGDMGIYCEIASYFSSRLPESLTELRVALECGNLTKATRLAHSMKNNCATVGAKSLSAQCLTLEKLCHDGALEKARILFFALSPQLLALQSLLRMV